MSPTAKLLEARCKRDALEAEYREACLDVCRETQSLNAQGMTLRELGELLGVSKQAISQLIARANDADRQEWEERQYGRRYDARALREVAKSERGLERGSFPCESCGKFKRRPADECPHCGSSAGSWNAIGATNHEINRAYGYAS